MHSQLEEVDFKQAQTLHKPTATGANTEAWQMLLMSLSVMIIKFQLQRISNPNINMLLYQNIPNKSKKSGNYWTNTDKLILLGKWQQSQLGTTGTTEVISLGSETSDALVLAPVTLTFELLTPK